MDVYFNTITPTCGMQIQEMHAADIFDIQLQQLN